MSTTIILSIVIISLLCIVPIVIISRRNKKAERAFKEKLFEFGKVHQGNIDQSDFLNNLAIGYASNTHSVFFIKTKKDQEIMEVIKLNEIATCQLSKPMRRSVDGTSSTIDRIELNFVSKNKDGQTKRFVLYDLESDSLSLQGELQLAEQWHVILSEKLKRGL
ncbi:MAG: hypothetical protein KF846_08240 [Cyclobacteriaceae bacterium]|nr:hypothetical protein [Cyclobacteriaceae bacterium]